MRHETRPVDIVVTRHGSVLDAVDLYPQIKTVALGECRHEKTRGNFPHEWLQKANLFATKLVPRKKPKTTRFSARTTNESDFDATGTYCDALTLISTIELFVANRFFHAYKVC